MIAADCEQNRINTEYVSKLVGPIWEKTLAERLQRDNQLLGKWF